MRSNILKYKLFEVMIAPKYHLGIHIQEIREAIQYVKTGSYDTALTLKIKQKKKIIIIIIK
jgi:hypothetical protein